MYGPQMSGPLACLEDLSLAWAVTVHKSQGSEYPVVLLPVSKWHQKLLRQALECLDDYLPVVVCRSFFYR